MTNHQPQSDNPLTVALREVFKPLVEKTSQLEPPLAYGSAILLAILVIVLLGAVIPDNLVWLMGIIVLICLAAFVFVDWDTRRSKERIASVSKPRGIGSFFVVVHCGNDRTDLVPDAEITLAFPEPVSRLTQSNGSAVFTIPNQYLGKSFPVNVRKEGYGRRDPQECLVEDQGTIYLALERMPDPTPKALVDQAPPPKTAQPRSRIRLTQVNPASESKIFESDTGLLSIGRNPACTLNFPADAPGISWDHGLIFLQGDEFLYRHLSEKQPTRLQRRNSEERLLRPGLREELPLRNQDRLTFGQFEYAVTYDLIFTGYVTGDRIDISVVYTGTKDPD